MPKTELFGASINPMAMLPESLGLISKDVTKRTLERVMTARDTGLEKELFEITKDEVEKRWLSEEINAVVNPRFGIRQGQNLPRH